MNHASLRARRCPTIRPMTAAATASMPHWPFLSGLADDGRPDRRHRRAERAGAAPGPARASTCGPVVLLCTLSDWLLIALGVFGLGALIAVVAAAAGGVSLRRRGLPAGLRPALGAARPGAARARWLQAGAQRPATLARRWPAPLRAHLPQPARLPRHRGAAGRRGRAAWRRRRASPSPPVRALLRLMWFVTLGYGAVAASRWLRQPGAPGARSMPLWRW